MPNRIDDILDECIDRITLKGETVEECLARYPDLAAELESQLRLSTGMARVFAFTPNPDAKATGRQRLQAEIRELQRQDNERKARPFSLISLLDGWRLRWAAAAALLLVVLLGGSGLVRAAGNALPGETLYSVKRATEQARLAIQFSEVDKAELHLDYAQRRALEARTLLTRGDTTHLEPTLDLLQQDLNAVTGIAGSVSDDAATRLESRLEVSASQSLAFLQESLQEAPEDNRQAASDSFLLASQVYGDTLESVAARFPERLLAAGLGTIQLWAADPPPPDVEQVLVEINRVEAHRLSGNESEWVMISDHPVTFDLLRVAQIQKFLGEHHVASGTYTRVRFSVASVTVVAAGVEHSARVPSGYISLPRPFRVAEDRTTVVVLDFDGEQSLRVTGRGRYMLTPVVRVLAQEPGHPDKGPDQGKEDIGGAPGQERGGPLLKDKSARRAEVEGDVESLTPDSLVVSGKRISISPDTETGAKPELGQKARVEVAVQPDGSLMATRVERVERTGPPEQSMPPEKTGSPDDKSVNDLKRPKPLEVEIEGVVQEISNENWIIGGHPVQVRPDTRLNREATIRDFARVKGTEQDDGSILADQIIVTRAPNQQDPPDTRDDNGRGKHPGETRPSP